MTPNRLTSVVLLNSYPKGQIHKLNVDNNTIITGRNASGKTTLMGAIVPFYGVTLSSVARKSEVKKSFVDFYLPYDNSYIIYEYDKEGRTFSVLLRNNNGTPVFHFINGAYHQEDFIEKRGDGLYFNAFDKIKQNIKARHLDISPQIKQSDYEAIISNCPPKFIGHYHKDSLRDIQRYRQDFSLVSHGKGNFFGFADIIYNVLQSKLEFHEICKFLVEAMQKQGLLTHSSISLKTHGINTELWLNQRQTWHKIEALTPKFTELTQLLMQHRQEQQSLAHLTTNARHFSHQFDEHCLLLEENKDAQQRQLARLSSELQELERNFLHQDNISQDKIENITNKINMLDKQKQDYEQGNDEFASVATLQDWKRQLPIWEREHEDKQQRQQSLQKELDKITVAINEIQRHFDEQIRQINHRFGEDDKLIATQRHQNETNYYRNLDDIKQNFNTQKAQQDEHYQHQKEQLDIAKADHEKRHAVIESQRNNRSYSNEITDQLNHINGQKREVRVALQKQNHIIQGKQQTLARIDDEINTNLTHHRQIDDQIDTLQTDIERLRALSKDNTLYGFLLGSEQDNPSLAFNVERIFKTINPQLLSRQDLSPTWAEQDDGGDYFGLALHTNALSMGEQMSLQDIYAKIGQEEHQISELEDERHKLQNEQKQLTKRQKTAKEDLQKEIYKKTRLDDELNRLEQEDLKLRQIAEQEVKERQERQSRELNAIASMVSEYRQKIATLTASHKQQQEQLATHQKQAINALTEQYNQDQHDLDERKHQLAITHQREIASTEAKRDTAIKNEGYDRSELTEIERTLKVLAERIQKANHGQKRLTAYDDFMTYEYVQLPTLQSQRQTEQFNRQTHKEQYHTHRDDKLTAISHAQEEIDELTKQLTQAQKAKDRLHKIITHADDRLDTGLLEQIGLDTKETVKLFDGVHWQMTAQTFYDHLYAQIQKTTHIIQQGKAVVEIIKKPFASHGGFVDSFSDEVFSRTTDTNWHIQAQAFEDYMAHEHENRKRLIIQEYITEAEKVNNFKLDLDNVHRALNKFTNQINKSCQSICNDLTELAIEEFSMAIHSSITDNEWYPILNEFSEQYQTWKGTQHQEKTLPNERLLASLENVQTYVGQNNLNVEYVKQFNIDLIVKQHGQPRQVAKGTQSFKELSSNGTIRIAQLILYLSLFHMMGTPEGVQLKLFIDEIGVLDEENTRELLQILHKNNISAMCAAPEVVHEAVIPLFANNIACRHDKNNVYDFSQIDDVSELGLTTKLENYGCFV